jgi:hypothetical protein
MMGRKPIPRTDGEKRVEAAYLVILALTIREHKRVVAKLRRKITKLRPKLGSYL